MENRKPPILELAGVGKRFGGLTAVDDVSFTVDEGEIVALVGPNGAGKSTLLKIIGGMDRPTNGTVRLGGPGGTVRLGGPGEIAGRGLINITGLKPHRARRAGVAIVLQTPRPFDSMTVRENAALGAMFGGTGRSESEALRAADRMLEFVGLADRSADPVTSLNLHEQRFLEVARQLAGEPSLILLDEVMAGLNDAELEHSVDMVRRARAEFGLTVVWVEHVMKAVMSLAERVLVLNFGRLIADGRPEQVMRQPDVVAAYLGDRAVVT